MNEKLRTPRLRLVSNDAGMVDLDTDMADFMCHLNRAKKLFNPIQPSNLEYEIIRSKEANREARAMLGLD